MIFVFTTNFVFKCQQWTRAINQLPFREIRLLKSPVPLLPCESWPLVWDSERASVRPTMGRAPGATSRTINFNCRPDSIILFYQQNRREPACTQTKSPCCGTIARRSISPVAEIGFNSITGGMQTHHGQSAIIYNMGLIGPCVYIRARCGKKRWAPKTSAPHVIWVVYLPLAFRPRLYRLSWIGDIRHFINLFWPCVKFQVKLFPLREAWYWYFLHKNLPFPYN